MQGIFIESITEKLASLSSLGHIVGPEELVRDEESLDGLRLAGSHHVLGAVEGAARLVLQHLVEGLQATHLLCCLTRNKIVTVIKLNKKNE